MIRRRKASSARSDRNQTCRKSADGPVAPTVDRVAGEASPAAAAPLSGPTLARRQWILAGAVALEIAWIGFLIRMALTS